MGPTKNKRAPENPGRDERTGEERREERVGSLDQALVVIDTTIGRMEARASIT
jgi:hypothetical protein